MESGNKGLDEIIEEVKRERIQERREKRKKRLKVLREIFGWILYILTVILVTYLIVTYVGQRTKVSGPSMEATLHDGDNLIVDKISYRFKDPERFDIIVFQYIIVFLCLFMRQQFPFRHIYQKGHIMFVDISDDLLIAPCFFCHSHTGRTPV